MAYLRGQSWIAVATAAGVAALLALCRWSRSPQRLLQGLALLLLATDLWYQEHELVRSVATASYRTEDEFELAPRPRVVAAMEPDRCLADALHQFEDIGAFLVAYRIAQNAPEQADVVPQPDIFLQRGIFLAAAGFQPVIRKHDLRRHRGNAPEAAGFLESQFLRRSARPRNRRTACARYVSLARSITALHGSLTRF